MHARDGNGPVNSNAADARDPEVEQKNERGLRLRRALAVLGGVALLGSACDNVAEPNLEHEHDLSASVSASGFQLNPDRVHLEQVGSLGLLSAESVDANGNVTRIDPTFSSKNASIVSVGSNGWITARRVGKTQIVARYGAVSATADITVGPAQTGSFQLTKDIDSIAAVGGTTRLTAEVVDPSGLRITNPVVTWSTPTPGIVRVKGSATATVTALAKGTGIVVAQRGSLRDTATVYVGSQPPPPPTPNPIGLSVIPGSVLFDQVGSVWKLAANYTDASGTVTITPTYKSTNGSVVQVDKQGWVRGIGMGSGSVIATYNAAADTVPVRVGNVQVATLRITNDPDSISAVGGTVNLLAEGLDPAGENVLNPKLTWSTLTPAIATVSGSAGVGRVTAAGVGQALIVVSRGSLADTATVYVGGAPPSGAPAASVVVTPSLDTLAAPGAIRQLKAVVLDAQGKNVKNQSVTWASLDAAIAGVDKSGLVTAIASGTARIVATQAALADTATMVVKPGAPQQPPPVGPTVQLQIVRMSGGSGTALVSNGIPLPPGWLRPGQSANLRIVVANQEQPVYVEELQGVHPDGSLRSVLVQFAYTVGSQPVAAQLVKGSTARTTAARAKAAVNYTLAVPIPQAVALPTDPTYLMSTRIVGPTVGIAEADAFEPLWQGRFKAVGNPKFALHIADYRTVNINSIIVRNYYDRGLINFAYWVRSGSAEHFKRGVYYTLAYRERYLQPNGYRVQPHEMHIEGVALLYTLLGDDESWKAVQENAVMLRDIWLPKLRNPQWQYTEGRPLARSIEAWITAMKVGIPGNWPATLRQALNDYLPQQQADGAYRYPNSCDLSSNFMSGLFNDALIRYWEEFEQDARIPTAVKRNIDWMWQTQWRASKGAFNYYEGYCPANPSIGMAGGNATPAPDLNLLIVNGFGFVYKVTGNSVYRQRGDQVFKEGIKRAYLGSGPNNGDKQFNQQYRSAFRYLEYRR